MYDRKPKIKDMQNTTSQLISGLDESYAQSDLSQKKYFENKNKAAFDAASSAMLESFEAENFRRFAETLTDFLQECDSASQFRRLIDVIGESVVISAYVAAGNSGYFPMVRNKDLRLEIQDLEDKVWLAQQRNIAMQREREEQNKLKGSAGVEAALSCESTRESALINVVKVEFEREFNEKGMAAILDEIEQHVIAEYEKIPARDSEGHALPLEFDEELNLDGAVRQAYYQNTAHTFWRYLQKPNPWMAPDAEFAAWNDSGQGWAKISQEDKVDMCYFWLATSQYPEAKATFSSILAMVGRGHNWDESRIVDKENPVTHKIESINEAYDDMRGDDPSCDIGVKQRLLPVLVATPYVDQAAGILSIATLEQNLAAALTAKLDDFIETASVVELRSFQAIYEKKIIYLDDITEDEQARLDELIFSQHDVIFLLKELNEKFGNEIFSPRNPAVILQLSNADVRPRQYESYADYFLDGKGLSILQEGSGEVIMNKLQGKLSLHATIDQAIQRIVGLVDISKVIGSNMSVQSKLDSFEDLVLDENFEKKYPSNSKIQNCITALRDPDTRVDEKCAAIVSLSKLVENEKVKNKVVVPPVIPPRPSKVPKFNK
jgi:hypothetical protein